MDSLWFRFGIAVLAVWRVGHLLARDNGPWNGFRLLRRSGLRAVSCFYCVTVWASIPMALFVVGIRWMDWLVCWLAIAGGAALLDRATAPPFEVQGEEPDELLRGERRNAEHQHA